MKIGPLLVITADPLGFLEQELEAFSQATAASFY